MKNELALITLKSVPDTDRGLLCIAQMDDQIPFPVKRYFTMSGMKKGTVRGDHAHRAQSQYFNALNGIFEIAIEGKDVKETFILDAQNKALNVPPMHWVIITAKTDDALMLVCSSELYVQEDYICDRTEFKSLIGKA